MDTTQKQDISIFNWFTFNPKFSCISLKFHLNKYYETRKLLSPSMSALHVTLVIFMLSKKNFHSYTSNNEVLKGSLVNVIPPEHFAQLKELA